MASKHFYFQLIFRVLLISITSLGMGFAFIKEWYMLLGALFLFIILQTYFLISYINSTNRKIAYFFDAIRNEDFTLRFPEKVSIKSFKELNQSLNRVNNLIQDVHLQHQIRERYYQVILNQASIGIMTYNAKGHILFANPMMEKLLNYNPLNHIKQLKQVDEKLYLILSSMQPFDRKLASLTNEREQIQLVIKSTEIRLGDQPLLLVVIQDIHKELDEKETVSWIKLIRVLTHEIMNTMAPMTSISESILKFFYAGDRLVDVDNLDQDKIENTVRGLEVINQQGTDLMEFVQSYRGFLSVPKPDKSIVKARKLFEKVQLLMHRDINSHIELNWSYSEDNIEFYIDEKQLTQVLINIVKNAIQALENQVVGQIDIIARIDQQGTKQIEVKDNGPGIPADILEDIFVPFFTTKEKGTGIGLSLSKQIMHLHGGDIRVYSTADNGTSFVLSF